MATNLNTWLGIGRLGRDPELKYAPSGDPVVNISIAVSKNGKDKNTGEKTETTIWVPVAFWGKTAEVVGQYCKKGTLIQVTGELNIRSYVDNSGVEKWVTEILGNRMEILSSRDSNGAGGGGGQAPARAPAPSQRQPAQRQAPARAAMPDDDSDVPF
jgi:single-strand DNA-binding protein